MYKTRETSPEFMITVYTEQENLTETEFFRREAGLELKVVQPWQLQMLSSNIGKRIWIASTNPEKWYSYLENCPSKSVIFFYLGNELYQTQNLELLMNLPSIIHLLVYAPFKNPTLSNLLSPFIAAIIDSGKFALSDLPTYLRNFRTGLHVKKRFHKLSQGKSSVLWEIPQGYSYAFAIQFSNLHPDLRFHESLITYSNTRMQPTPANRRKYSICFVGQRGNLRRTRILQLAEKTSGFEFFKIVKDRYGGSDRLSNMEYLRALESSTASLIPSGAFNNYNHRYCEALIMGKLPIVALNNLTDPNVNYYWTKRYPFVLRDSYRWLLFRFSRLTEAQIEGILEQSQLEEFAKIRAFSNLISKLRGEISK